MISTTGPKADRTPPSIPAASTRPAIVTVPLSAELRQPQVEETKLIPIPDSPIELDSKKGAKPLSLPKKVTPQVETPADSKSD